MELVIKRQAGFDNWLLVRIDFGISVDSQCDTEPRNLVRTVSYQIENPALLRFLCSYLCTTVGLLVSLLDLIIVVSNIT